MESDDDEIMCCSFCDINTGEDYYVCDECDTYLCVEHVITNENGSLNCRDCFETKE